MMPSRIVRSRLLSQVCPQAHTLVTASLSCRPGSRLLPSVLTTRIKRNLLSSNNAARDGVSDDRGDHGGSNCDINASSETNDYESSESQPERWSIQRLAELNGCKLDTATTYQGSESMTASAVADRVIQSETARTLMNDVSERLARQHENCAGMLHQLQYGEADGSTTDMQPIYSSSDSPPPTSNGRKKIIKAVNNFNVQISLKEQQHLMGEAKRLEVKATKLLNDLQAVHRDTLKLTHDILNHDILARFNPVDQSTTAAVIEQIRSRHATTVEMLADITLDLRHKSAMKKRLLNLSQQSTKCQFVSEFMVTDFLQDRLTIQLLCDHYLGFHKKRPYGGISPHVPIWDVVTDAVTEMTHLCDANHGWCPPVELDNEWKGIVDRSSDASTATTTRENMKMTLIRPWVHHALGEVLKNAMEATVQQHTRSPSSQTVPLDERVDHVTPIVVLVDPSYTPTTNSKQDEYLAIHVVDRGMGFRSPKDKARAFLFAETGFSGHDQRWDRLQDQQSYAAVRSPLSSLGVGLSLSRMMMRLFGGDVLLKENSDDEDSEHGSGGCTATVLLPKDLTIMEHASLP
jgi:pyruvate dehydrogenase kinase 2/3/4